MKKLILFCLLLGIFVPLQAQQSLEWRAEYDTCRINFNDGNIKESLTWLEKALDEYKAISKDDTILYYEMVNLLARCYLKMGNNPQAEEYFREDIEYFQNRPGEITKSTYTSSVLYLGFSYYNMRRYTEAEVYFAEALELRREEIGEKNPVCILLFNNLATLYNLNKKYEQADSLFQKVLVLKKEVYGINSPEYAKTLNSLGILYKKMGRMNEAEPLIIQAASIRKQTLGEKTPETITSLNNLASLYLRQGRYHQAEPLYRQVASLSKEVYPPADDECIKPLNNLASLYRTMGKYPEAEKIFTEVLQIREEADGTNNLNYTSALINLATLYKAMSEYNKSEMYFLSAMSIYEVIIGEYHESYVSALVNLAGLYREMGRLQEAEPLYNKALEIYQLTTGERNITYANLLNNIALFYDEVGRYEQAEEYYKRALDITSSILGDQHPEYATTLNNLALLYKNTGHFEQAEPIYMQAGRIRKERFGEKHQEYAASLNNLASLYESMGRNEAAEPLYMQSLEILKEIFGNKNPHYAHALNNLAGLYQTMNRYIDAEKLYNEALEIIRLVLGEKHHDYATTLNNLALLQQQRGNFKQSEKLYLENIQKTKESLGVKHPNYAASLNNMAGLYEKMGKYKEAEKLYIEAHDIRKEVLGTKHPAYAVTLTSMARLYTVLKKYDVADTLWDKAIENYLYQIHTYFPSMSEKEKGQFYKTISAELEHFNSYALLRHTSNPHILSGMYNNELATKALLLNSSNKLRQRIMGSGDPELINLYKSWLSQKEHLSKIYSMTKEEIKKLAINVDSIETVANSLEKKLSLKSELFKTTNEVRYYRWQDVQKELKHGDAAIEMIRFTKYKFDSAGVYTDSVLYAALIIKHHTKDHPELVILNNGNHLENKFIKYYKNSVKFKSEDPISYAQFWQRIGEKLTDVKKVYFSPDGVYNQINLNTLQNAETKKYVFDEIELHPLTNTRDLLNKRTSHHHVQQKKIATILGNPNYTYEGSAVVPSGKKDATLNTAPAPSKYDGLLTPLPGTEGEAKKIDQMMGRNRWATKIYLGNAATEENIKAVDNPRILHIATHGFFERDVENTGKISENPLLRSGLMLSGASVTLYNKTHVVFNSDKVEKPHEDGILTAFEAMNLNLDGTDLVVLSACETGMGEVKNGEGVYGLQRAFIIAGAKSIIISLWKVNDETTQKLMIAFYEDFLKNGDKKAAFRKAQVKLKEEFPEPYYWGAFVMIGD